MRYLNIMRSDFCTNCRGVVKDRARVHRSRFKNFGYELREKLEPRLRKSLFGMYHEELMAKAWHPTRVARWLDAGEEILDMMLGV
jgi:hypothetical protein